MKLTKIQKIFLLVLGILMATTLRVSAATKASDVAFDASFYAQRNPDVVKVVGTKKASLYNRFINHGLNEGRQPSLYFNINYYMANNPDVVKAAKGDKKKCYLHFVNCGLKEGRKAVATFDVKYYVNNYSDLKKVFGTNYIAAYNHFLRSGIKEGRSPISGFDVKHYIGNYSDLQKTFGKNYAAAYNHYALSGYKEGRNKFGHKLVTTTTLPSNGKDGLEVVTCSICNKTISKTTLTDTEAPAIELPEGATVYLTPGTYTVNLDKYVKVTDDYGVASVTYDIERTPTGESTTYPTEVSANEAVDTTYVVEINAKDTFGNESTETLTIIVDATPLTLISSNANTDDLINGTEDENDIDMPVFADLTASKDDATIKCIVTDEEENSVECTTDEEVLAAIEFGEAHVYTVEYVAEDKAGRKATVTYTLTIDAEGPVFYDAATDGNVLEDKTIYVNASNNTTTYATLPIIYVEDAIDSTTRVATNAPAVTPAYNNAAAGTYEAVYTENDTAGNTSTLTLTYIVDLTAPTVTVTSNPETYTSGSVVVTVSATEAIELTDDLTDAGWGWTAAATADPDDVATYHRSIEKPYTNNTTDPEEITIKDIAGNAVTRNITVNNIVKTKSSITGIQGTITDDTNVTDVLTTVTPVFTGTAVLSSKATKEATSYDTVENANFTSGTTYNTTGYYQLVVTNYVGLTTTVTFEIDTVDPVLPVSAIYFNKSTETVGEMNKDNTTLINAIKSKVTDTNLDTVVINTIAGDAEGVVDSAAEGDYTVNVTATDKAGNATTGNVTVTVDNTLPTVLSITPNTTNPAQSVIVVITASEDLIGH